MSKSKQLKHPAQPTYTTEDGVHRFKPNAVIRYLFNTKKLNLNEIAELEFPDEDMQQLTQLLGYSVGGYRELYFTASDKREYKVKK